MREEGIAQASGVAKRRAGPLGNPLLLLYCSTFFYCLMRQKTLELRRLREASFDMHIVGAQQNTSGRNTDRQAG